MKIMISAIRVSMVGCLNQGINDDVAEIQYVLFANITKH